MPLVLLGSTFISVLSAHAESFDFKSWKSDRGAHIPINEWAKANPSPYRSYFPSAKPESMKEWYINLGPIGTRNLMHDRSWDMFDACVELYPKALTDEHGLVFNNFEVQAVRKNSPAEGQLQKGDYIVALDGQRLKAAQHMFLDHVVDNKVVRGIEIHAGNIIDKAEGCGEIKVTVLRLPENLEGTKLTGLREWKSAQSVKIDGATELAVPITGADLCRIRLTNKRAGVVGEGLSLRNEKGETIPVQTSYKKTKPLDRALEVPEGDWTLVGSVTSKKPTEIVIETMAAVPFPESLKKHLKTLTLKIDKIGSFGDDFDPEGEKARNYAKMIAHRLATQQDADGSWNAKSYASKSFYTSVIAMSLMTTDDPQYDDNIKRAAYYVANAGERDKWSYSNGMWLVFLSEYYLKTQDQNILPALKMCVANARRYIHSDYTSGHSAGGPGYGGTGYIGGGGVLALGFAVASHTPAMDAADLDVLDKMLSRVQELAPHGEVPYGRVGKSMATTPTPGQGGACGTGPYYIASLVRGGAPMFTSNAAARYSTAPFGSAENGHATQTLHFVWSCLSSANSGSEAHRQNMNDYLWKFTTLRDHDGFVNQNGYRVEYHNGDSVIGGPYWRMAGYLMILNAHKQNLATTGNPKYRHAPRELPVVFHRHRATYNEVLRNWALAEAFLGDKVPSSFTKAVKALRSIKQGPEIGADLRSVLTKYASTVAKDILQIKDLPKGLSAGQLVELVMGVSFEAACHPDLLADVDLDEIIGAGANKEEQKAAKKELKTMQKKKQKLFDSGKLESVAHRLVIRPVSRLQEGADASPSEMGIASSLFKMEDLTIQVADQSKKYLKQTIKEQIDPAKFAEIKRGKPEPGEEVGQMAVLNVKTGETDSLLVKVSYKLDGIPISYVAPMEIPAPEARNYVPVLTQVPVQGTVTADWSNTYSMLVKLRTGEIIGCEHRNNPANYLLVGAQYDFEISPGSTWGHDLRAATARTPDFRIAKLSSVSGADGGEALNDHKNEGAIKLDEGETVLTLNLEKEQVIQRAYIKFAAAEAGKKTPNVEHRFEAYVDGDWQLLRKGFISGMMPTIELKTNKVRLTLEVPKGGALLQEVNFITPAAIATKSEMSW